MAPDQTETQAPITPKDVRVLLNKLREEQRCRPCGIKLYDCGHLLIWPDRQQPIELICSVCLEWARRAGVDVWRPE